ncbi:unnamed protein product [Allacma fusca]|uniref:Uncharacterized protein n=1 Tax=Allacma fusca TaxID=39272 RepID=A0A8J2LQE6_9HEXA|nr:unnamed protein product [Allacma fusca]
MDSIGANQFPKIVKVLSHRSGRFYFGPNDPFAVALMESRTRTGSISQDNPMVVTSVAAGVLGVILVIVIIFSVWIRRRCYSPEEMRHRLAHTSRAQCTNASLSSSSFVYTIPRVHTNAIVISVPDQPSSDPTLQKVEVV